MAHKRKRALNKLYKEDYNRLVSGKRPLYYSFQDLYPTLFPYTHLPRKKKKQFKKKWSI